MQVLVASDGLPRLELFKDNVMVDLIHVQRYNADQLNLLLERDLGQTRDRERTWEKLGKLNEAAGKMD